MRPTELFPLFAPVSRLPGVGPKIEKLLSKLAGPRPLDLIWHLPVSLIDRRLSQSIAEAVPGRTVTLRVRVDTHQAPGSSRQPYRVYCMDATGTLVLAFFHPRGDYLTTALPPKQWRTVSGLLEVYGDFKQMVHPDYILGDDDARDLPQIESVYPLTAGLTNRTLGRCIRAALDRLPDLPEWLDPALQAREGWPAWAEAIKAAHNPARAADLQPQAPPRARLAYDELLANQLALRLIRRHMQAPRGQARSIEGSLAAQALERVGFTLTAAQTQAIADINADMASAKRMLRLLQGDVGSGKTVVALVAMLNAVEGGAQAILMAPTEILARQHHQTIAPLAEAAGVRAVILTGRDKGRARDVILEDLAAGGAPIAIGTHALFQEGVRFNDVGLCVIDEQHRFGVHQRMLLAAKGSAPDVLVMTATPIPRSLVLTAYGDMDVSRITEKPPGRRPIATRVVPAQRLGEVVDAVGRQIDSGAKVYWVCPLVEESDSLDMAAAEARCRDLRDRFGDRVGLLHGRMKATDKDTVMARFAEGEMAILVATTVIEVGVDVPAATVMVIEQAERFGLAQLHQLRGRVGRGERDSSCLLLYAPPLTEQARRRLEIMRRTEDGFLIAEEDLKLRGAGELLGTRQSGAPDFRVADPDLHGNLLEIAGDDAKLIVERDPYLRLPRGEALRVLLHLFERDAAVRYLRSG